MTTDAHGNIHDRKGLFATKNNTAAPDGILRPQSAPSATAQLQREQWSSNGEEADPIGTDDFEINAVLDTYSIEEIEGLLDTFSPENRDELYNRAAAAGYVKPHDGPYTLYVEEENVEDYLAYRRDKGLDEPVTDVIVFSPSAQAEMVNSVLREAYTGLNVTELFEDKFSDGPNIKERFQKAAHVIGGVLEGGATVDAERFRADDLALYERIVAVANRDGAVSRRDPEAQIVAVKLMERLLQAGI